MMVNRVAPALWLLVAIAGLSQLSETVYTPSLPEIAHAFGASESMVEYTLTVYLAGFALGVFFWGVLSDRLGRKPCVIAGLLIFACGSLVCYTASSMSWLMVGRLMQGFGASIGSVLGQAMCRDAFHGPALGKAYASVGGALALFPAVGPIIGGCVVEFFDWSNVFLFLCFFGLSLSLLVTSLLPETHLIHQRRPISMRSVAWRLLCDKKVIGLGIVVAGGNGINFSYFAEGSFCLITILGLSPSQYGYSFIWVASGAALGALTAKKMHDSYTGPAIVCLGLIVMGTASFILTGLMLWSTFLLFMTSQVLVSIVIGAMMLMMFGVSMSGSTALAMALVDYKDCTGTASSLFGCFYYIITSLCTWSMGALHNGTLWVMPAYFLGISLMMLISYKYFMPTSGLNPHGHDKE